MELFSSDQYCLENQEVHHPILTKAEVSLFIKREDKIHPTVSGNKFRKLKYNLLEAKRLEYHKVLTFGGAFSNHIAATAAACSIMGFESIGVIRGEELGMDLKNTLASNKTLAEAFKSGMNFDFISRSAYRDKESASFVTRLQEKYGDFYCIPEGGTNDLAVEGCKEILCKEDQVFDVICAPVGTGGTISGIINGTFTHQQVLGFPALKGNFLQKGVSKYCNKKNWELIDGYHFGGYAKVNNELITFINLFKKEQQILLDPVYTGKMIFGIFDMINNGFFRKNTRILAVHTGGLQGITGMNDFLQKKNLPTIEI